MEQPNILIIDTSTSNLKIAVSSGGKDFFIDEKNNLNHIERLIERIDSGLLSINADKNELNFVGICTGPGSFTGIRIGIATAIGIAYSLNIKTFGFTVFDIYKFLMKNENGAVIIPIIDAKKNKFYCSFIDGRDDYEMYDLSFDELYEKVKTYDKKIIFAGKDFGLIKDKINLNYQYLYENDYSSTDMIGFASEMIALKKELPYPEPVYLRKSEAEIALLEKYKEKTR